MLNHNYATASKMHYWQHCRLATRSLTFYVCCVCVFRFVLAGFAGSPRVFYEWKRDGVTRPQNLVALSSCLGYECVYSHRRGYVRIISVQLVCLLIYYVRIACIPIHCAYSRLVGFSGALKCISRVYYFNVHDLCLDWIGIRRVRYAYLHLPVWWSACVDSWIENMHTSLLTPVGLRTPAILGHSILRTTTSRDCLRRVPWLRNVLHQKQDIIWGD